MKEIIYLGISLGFNSSAALVSNKRGVLFAISEERLNNEKNTKKFPELAIKHCCLYAFNNDLCVNKIVVSYYGIITKEYFNKYCSIFTFDDWHTQLLRYCSSMCKIDLKSCDTVIESKSHQLNHATATLAFYNNKHKDYYLVSSDGFGLGLSGAIYDRDLHLIDSVELSESVGLVYQFTTGALGFKEHQHEGKLTGLAAFGKPIYKDNFYNLFCRCSDHNGLSYVGYKTLDRLDYSSEEIELIRKNHFIPNFGLFMKLKNSVYTMVQDLLKNNASREDISASLQKFSEEVTINWLKRYCNRKIPVFLSGGLFANVKINQAIKDSGIFTDVYVCPPMGDEGTAIGCCVSDMLAHGIFKIKIRNSSNTPCVGPDVDSEYITNYEALNILDELHLADKYSISIVHNKRMLHKCIVSKLKDNKVVCYMNGKLEFGPRALCHRSILYNADAYETNNWLNEKLNRSEFMPFAPVCLDKFANDLFKNIKYGRQSAKYMTMTFDATDYFISNCKAACHIDNTARPQIISKRSDKDMYNILMLYYKLTNKKALINTSWNLHNYPIICRSDRAIRDFIKADLDVLVIGNVVISKI